MKNKTIRITTILLGASLCFASGFLASKQNIKNAEAYNHTTKDNLKKTLTLSDSTNTEIRNYYKDLIGLDDDQLQGQNLLKNLKPILSNGQKYFSYDANSGKSNSIWCMYEIIDRDWEKSPAIDVATPGSPTYISGATYDASTKTLSGYKYAVTDPYVHALYYDREYENYITAWGNHGGSSRSTTELSMEREHIWPKSHGFDEELSTTGGARGDPMHLWAAEGWTNGVHSDNFYGNVDKTKNYTNCGTHEFTTYTHFATSEYAHHNYSGTSLSLKSGTVFEPQDSDKGDIARALFYMVARYNNIAGNDSTIDSNNPNLCLSDTISTTGGASTATTPFSLGILHDLLEWHKSDPVDAYEIHRNNLLFKNFSENRNPFIDFPEWVDFIWGTPEASMTYSDPTGIANPNEDTINGYNDTTPSTAVVDTLDCTLTGITTNQYFDFSNKTVSTSDAVYAGRCAGNYSTIQLTNSGSDKGVIQTASGGVVGKVTVEWNSNTGNARKLNIYGKNTAYSSASDLYSDDTNTQGTLLGSITNGTSTSLTISDDYEYIGFRSNSQALYLDKVYIEYKEVATSITATANRAFHPGEVITSSDITVIDDLGNNIEDFEFSQENYRFEYEDTVGAGLTKNVTFEDAISYKKLTCDLTVHTSRREYNSLIKNDSITFGDLETQTAGYNDFSNITLTSGAVYAGNAAGTYSSVQLNNSSPKGIITTTSGGKLLSVVVEWNSNTKDGNELSVYAKTTAYSSGADLYDNSTSGTLLGTIKKGTSTSLEITGNYTYIGIRAKNGAVYMDSVTISYSGEETAVNVANYIMFEDRNNQCLTKLDLAIGKLNTMSTSEKSTFWEAETYVLASAKERLQAWATHEKKTVVYSNGTFTVVSASKSMSIISNKSDVGMVIVTIVAIGTTSMLAIALLLKKKKEQ